MDQPTFRECIRKLNLVKAAAEEKGLGQEALASIDFVSSKLTDDAKVQEARKPISKKIAASRPKVWKPSFNIGNINQAMGNFDNFIKSKVERLKKKTEKPIK